MKGDSETKSALENASNATGVKLESLMTMAIVESSGRKNIGTNKYGYTGLMQLGPSAIKDIQKYDPKITYEGVKDDVTMNALGGAIYWQQNQKELTRFGLPTDVLHQYLAHQLEATGLNNMINTIKDNPNAPLTKSQIPNVRPSLVKEKGGIDKITQQDFYND